MELQPEVEARAPDFYGLDHGPGKVVVRRGKMTPKGRSLSLSQVSTVDSAAQGSKSEAGGLFSAMDALTKAHSSGRVGSKASVQTTSTMESRPAPSTRPSSGNSRVLQSGAREVLSRRHTIDDRRVPASTPLARRHTIDEGSLPSRSQSNGAMERRPSDAALEASNGFQSKKKSALDMTPRTARKYRIHQHRLSLDGATDEKPHHRDVRRGSHMGAESLAIMAIAKKYEEGSDDDVDPRLCGFLVDDRVTTAEGPDADGPWKHMGVGCVVEPGPKKGMLQILFADTRQVFGIRACNLLNITNPARSGKYALPEKHARIRNTEGSTKQHTDAMEAGKARQRSTMAGLSAQQMKDGTVSRELKTEGIPATEPNKYTFRDGCGASGLEIGDTVGCIKHRHLKPLGVIVKEGTKVGEVLVRVGDLGVRSFPCSELSKIEFEAPRDKGKAAQRASFVNTSTRKSFTLTVDEAMSTFSNEPQKEVKVWKRDPDPIVDKKVQVIEVTATHCFVYGDYVRVAPSSEKMNNPMWSAMGIGFVRGPGDRPGTIQVQFDSGSEAWTLFSDDLEHVDRSETTDRMFQQLNPSLLAKRRGSA